MYIPIIALELSENVAGEIINLMDVESSVNNPQISPNLF